MIISPEMASAERSDRRLTAGLDEDSLAIDTAILGLDPPRQIAMAFRLLMWAMPV
jgi:hypothetical protein